MEDRTQEKKKERKEHLEKKKLDNKINELKQQKDIEEIIQKGQDRELQIDGYESKSGKLELYNRYISSWYLIVYTYIDMLFKNKLYTILNAADIIPLNEINNPELNNSQYLQGCITQDLRIIVLDFKIHIFNISL